LSSTLDLETVLTTIVSRAVQLSGLDGGGGLRVRRGTPRSFVHRAATETGGALAEARRATRVRKGEGVVGRTAIHAWNRSRCLTSRGRVPTSARTARKPDRVRHPSHPGPCRWSARGQLIGCLVVSRNRAGNFAAETVELLAGPSPPSRALAIQNARLFHEIADKSRQARDRQPAQVRVSWPTCPHELRTAAETPSSGFSEVAGPRGCSGTSMKKQTEYLHDHPGVGPASAVPHQRHPRPVEDRGRPDGSWR